ncbi:hypothetical protein [Aquimarina agarilytica]|uniref:hypothetical protein n=1 Tax=Aquimarina agarilytica TaxID=1087449 RepID=UPI0002D99213|nr:hypothetical protein [Aquimarina agarilytica]
MKMKKIALALCSLSIAFTSCGDDDDNNAVKPDPVVPNQEEVITNINFTLTPTTGTPVVLKFEDLDGDGGNAPTITGGTLKANTTYTGVLELLNNQNGKSENVTEEIIEEDEDHQLFYASSIKGVTIAYTDKDADNNPLGITTTVTTGDAGMGNINLKLRHQPNKSAEGVKEGKIGNAGGVTEADVTFDINVVE